MKGDIVPTHRALMMMAVAYETTIENAICKIVPTKDADERKLKIATAMEAAERKVRRATYDFLHKE